MGDRLRSGAPGSHAAGRARDELKGGTGRGGAGRGGAGQSLTMGSRRRRFPKRVKEPRSPGFVPLRAFVTAGRGAELGGVLEP